MCYRGQSNVITVVFPRDAASSWESVAEAFKVAYRDRYGRLLDGVEPVLVNARTSATGQAGITSLSSFIRLPTVPAPRPRVRRVFYGNSWHDAQLVDRHKLPQGSKVYGPTILTQADCTTFVEPGFQAVVHSTGNIIIEARA
jgi:N-methylhydantoinase A/oxoprolinase/acetone carboxylase beta subunit